MWAQSRFKVDDHRSNATDSDVQSKGQRNRGREHVESFLTCGMWGYLSNKDSVYVKRAGLDFRQ